MSEICVPGVAWETFGSYGSNPDKQLALPYTDDEEMWLMNMLHKVQDIHKSVNLGEETIKEFMMYTLDVPLSKKFMKSKHYKRK